MSNSSKDVTVVSSDFKGDFVLEWLKDVNNFQRKDNYIYEIKGLVMAYGIRNRFVLPNGDSISIQRGEHSYCDTRDECYMTYSQRMVMSIEEQFKHLKYMLIGSLYEKPIEEITVELGFPTWESDILKEYAEDEDDLTESVYGRVPVRVVQEAILQRIKETSND